MPNAVGVAVLCVVLAVAIAVCACCVMREPPARVAPRAAPASDEGGAPEKPTQFAWARASVPERRDVAVTRADGASDGADAWIVVVHPPMTRGRNARAD